MMLYKKGDCTTITGDCSQNNHAHHECNKYTMNIIYCLRRFIM